MFWWIFKILPDVASIFLAAVALVAIVKPEWLKQLEGEKRKQFRTFAAIFLIVLGLAAVVSNQVQKALDGNKAITAQNGLQHSIDDLKDQLRAGELTHAAETQYLRGRLDELSQFTPAILKLAEASEENTRREYEQKVFSNKELRDFTANVVLRMRSWEDRKKQADSALFSRHAAQQAQVWHAGADFASGEPQRQLDQLRSQETAQTLQNETSFQQEFRDKILRDAIFARDQLITRLGQKAQPEITVFPGGIGSLLIFQGQFFGNNAVEIAANYLEQFAKKLSP